MKNPRGVPGSQKMQNTQKRMLGITLALYLSLSTTAFTTQHRALTSSKGVSLFKQVKYRDQDFVEGDTGEEGDDDGWVSWMARGKKSGTSELKMREPEELGGVPRSDRYSSR